MASSIPVIGTAIVNNPYWLHRLFMSIDYPVDNFVVFNNNGRGQITEEVEAVIDKVKLSGLSVAFKIIEVMLGKELVS